MASKTPFYLQVVRVTNLYLGPAADRFLSRQVQNHLHKELKELTAQDLGALIDWIQVAVSVVTEDPTLVQEYIAKLRHLAEPKGDNNLGKPHAV